MTKIKSNKNLFLLGGVIVALTLIVIWLTVLILTRPVVTDTENVTVVETVEKSVTTNSMEEDLTEVMELSKNLIADGIEIASVDVDKKMIALEEGDFSVLPEDFKNKFRFASTMNIAENKVLAYQSFIALAMNIDQANKDLKEVDGWRQAIFIDQGTGIAAVPVSVFTGINNGFFLQWEWVDGKWMYSPYPAVQSSILAATITTHGNENPE